jgi:F0F1-type ATP synthase assembly protein I
MYFCVKISNMGVPEKPEEKPSARNQLKPYLKYSGMAVQMVAILVLAALGGQWLDHVLGMKHPVSTVVLMLTGLLATLYLVISSVMKNK